MSVILVTAALGMGPAPVTAQEVPDDFVIELERTSCFGECPVYSVRIDARGNVTYEGKKCVRIAGRHTNRIHPSRVAALLATAERIGFFELRAQYRTIRNPDGTETSVTDLPTTVITITRSGRAKRVENYIGAPADLEVLEQHIDDAARTKRWIRIDEPTLRQLVANGWSPSFEERAELLRKALQHDEVDVVKALLDIGADPNVGYYGTNTTPLMMVRSAAAARALIEAGAIPFIQDDTGGTPLGSAVYLAPDVTQVLLKAGVQVDQPGDVDSRTPLFQASCAGNVGVVELLLKAGANPAVRVGATSAVGCAREGKEFKRSRRYPLLGRKSPFIEDFDGVIALLEQALAQPK